MFINILLISTHGMWTESGLPKQVSSHVLVDAARKTNEGKPAAAQRSIRHGMVVRGHVYIL